MSFDVTHGGVVIGCRTNSVEFVSSLLAQGHPVAGAITLDPVAAARNQVPSPADLRDPFSNRFPVYAARSYALEDPADRESLSRFRADIGFCIGWQRLLPAWLLARFRNGVFGMHCCQFPLPRGRGRSPINWGVIDGAECLQAHIFRYSDAADRGDLLCVTPLPVTLHDDIKTLQQKARVIFNREVARRWQALTEGEPELFAPQAGEKEIDYPKRTAEDGLIDWRWTTRRVHDWVRAQTEPYPGAFTEYEGRRYKVWRAVPFGLAAERPALPGTVVERFEDHTLAVQAGDGWISLLRHELPPTLAIGARLRCP